MSIQKNGIIKTTEFLENSQTGSTYTINGAVSVINGIAGNFSATAWINPSFTVANTATLDFYFFHIIPATTRITSNHEVLFGSNNANKFKLGINKSSWKWQFWNGSAWTQSTMGATVGTSFDLWLSWDGSNYRFYAKASTSSTWTLLVTFASTESQLYSNLFLGRNYSNNPEFFSGTMDLTRIFFYANGKLVWSGADAYTVNTYAKIGKSYITSNNFYEV